VRLGRSRISARAAGTNSAQTFCHYGVSNGERTRLVLQNHEIYTHFYSNFEIGLLTKPWDDDCVRFNNSDIGLACAN
jgi:hypothetical protein